MFVQERNELKARARDEAAAQEARKNKVTITVDLLGRQVSHDGGKKEKLILFSDHNGRFLRRQPEADEP